MSRVYVNSIWVSGLIVLFAFPAVSQEPAPSPPPADTSGTSNPATQPEAAPAAAEVPEKFNRNHRHQGNVNIVFGSGWYIAAPYDKNDPYKACGYEENGEAKAVCSDRSAMYLDFIGGFALSKTIELLIMYRQGLEEAVLGRPQLRLLGAGIKFYSPGDTLFKMGVGVVPMVDFSEKTGTIGNDFVIHIPILTQWDIVRWFGIYLQVAPNISFVSEFRIDLTYGIGVQGRFP